ncbi:MAG: acetate kinase [Deltaproteobacteria bacterium]|nr:acetate kinase [Deltaproteobacteria bacterium]
MKILVINCGSSSIKYRVFQTAEPGGLQSLAGGAVNGLGRPDAVLEHQSRERESRTALNRPDHRRALEAIMNVLTDHAHGGDLWDASEIGLVGHRAVHGGDRFAGAVFVDGDVIAGMQKCIPLAPVHNPANLEGIRQAMNMLPRAGHVAVFDTAFHQTLPQRAYMYGLPYDLYEKHGIRKYGFHGTSCGYVAVRAAEVAGRELSRSKSVIFHLGNGVTVAAVKNGRSVDTSLGLTPLEGAMMGTRCGDLDPGVVLYLLRELNLSREQVERMLNHDSGILGVSGRGNDMRRIIGLAHQGDHRCKLALEMYVYRLKKYMGAYAAAMGGIDLVAFAGGVGENSPLIRKMILDGMGFLGIDLDLARNEEAGAEDCILGSDVSRVDVVLVHTKEELMIAREALALAKRNPGRTGGDE